MRKSILFFMLTIAVSLYGYAQQTETGGSSWATVVCAQQDIDKASVKSVMDKVNRYQLTHPWAEYDDNWIRGTYYAGVMACYQATGDKSYLEQCDALGRELNWKAPSERPDVNSGGGGNLLTLAQTWLESYMVDPQKYKIEPLTAYLENPVAKSPTSMPLDWYFESGRRYVDGLFTGAPPLAMLYSITKDEKYLQWMESFFWDIYGSLYDLQENLFYRDARYITRTTTNGQKVIWSRGNGWAIAAIARVLKYLPKEHASCRRYVQVLKNMAQALKKCQSKEGFWYPNLADPNDYPVKETSGTSFFVYGLAWGVNNGILDYDEYRPVIEKAWRSLVDAVDDEGKLQWGQQEGDRPVNIVQDDSHEYVSGTFLLAASEVYQMCDKWLLTDNIQSFKDGLKTASGITKTGLKKQDYLKIIEGEVRAMMQYQNEEGRIIDPVKQQEMYYSTPCYAHSIAALAASGYTKDAALIESGMKAMDIVTSDMARNWSAGRHGDFYTWPVMFAYRLYKGIATDDRRAEWLKHIADMRPDKFYYAYQATNGNWALVNTAGEFLRFKENLRPLSDVDTCLKNQIKNFTGYGMYNENGNPFAYDLFPRHYLSGMLAHGYRGACYEQLHNLLDKGAWMSLFLQSPFGEMPAGFRSAHHIWNEAEQCVVFEIYAAEYAKRNDMKTAEAFKRAAMLSLSSIKSWIRPDGSGYIVKNKYPVEAEHGYEGYSVHACYNMLATSMLAQAWEFSDDNIREGIAPADAGGFVVPVKKPFHKIISSSGGTYIEYDTQGDMKYNPTGIIRIHLKGSNPQLGPSDGCAELFSGKGIAIATGPAWQNADGTWSSLAEMQQVEPSVEVLDETSAMTRFRVFYKTKDVSIAETITCEKGKITVEDELLCKASNMRITWPVLTFNGKDKTDVRIDGNTATLRLEGKSIRFTALEPANASLSRSGKEYKHRNGIMEPLFFDFQGNKAKYCIYL